MEAHTYCEAGNTQVKDVLITARDRTHVKM